LNKYRIDNHGNPTKESFIEILNEIRSKQDDTNLYERKKDLFAAKITLAGETFIKSLIPSFEFYASKYHPNGAFPNDKRSLPLFAYAFFVIDNLNVLTADDFIIRGLSKNLWLSSVKRAQSPYGYKGKKSRLSR